MMSRFLLPVLLVTVATGCSSPPDPPAVPPTPPRSASETTAPPTAAPGLVPLRKQRAAGMVYRVPAAWVAATAPGADAAVQSPSGAILGVTAIPGEPFAVTARVLEDVAAAVIATVDGATVGTPAVRSKTEGYVPFTSSTGAPSHLWLVSAPGGGLVYTLVGAASTSATDVSAVDAAARASRR